MVALYLDALFMCRLAVWSCSRSHSREMVDMFFDVCLCWVYLHRSPCICPWLHAVNQWKEELQVGVCCCRILKLGIAEREGELITSLQISGLVPSPFNEVDEMHSH